MNDAAQGLGLRRATLAAGLLVIVLALGALVWPGPGERTGTVMLVVFDPSGAPERMERFYGPLARVLTEVAGRPVAARVVRTLDEVRTLAAEGEVFVFGPDALALGLAADLYAPVVVGRRPPPQNLRPRGVLVQRRSAPPADEPWRTHPLRTVLGDSVSLTVTGAWRLRGRPAADLAVLASGPDPYDHAAALHALRLGGFDYALVRQWDADRFFSQGLLDPAVWAIRETTPPVPDLVLMAPRSLAGSRRLELGVVLTRIGRQEAGAAVPADALGAGVGAMHLTGFNLLVDPDLERIRRLTRAGEVPMTE